MNADSTTGGGLVGSLDGLKVVELASEHAALAGKMLGDLGADVIVVEPPGGHASRGYGPFADDVEDPERSLWWWNYNTSKRGVVLDLTTDTGAAQFRRLVADADIVLEGEVPGALAALGLDHPELRASDEGLIWVSVTAYGREGTRAHEPATDLTLLAGGGPAWSCGYDDHSLPPVRGGGNQAFHIGSTWAVMGALTAVLAREVTGRGQHVDVSMHAACNVTTEMGTYGYLAGHETVLRQTGRHAMPTISMPTQMRCADGRYVTTGFPPRSQRDFESLLEWIETLGYRDEFPETMLLDLAIERGGVSIAEMSTDDLARDIFGAGREALNFIAERITAEEFFIGGQTRGLACGVVASPEEAFEAEHIKARGFQVEIEHEQLGRAVRYPGAPFLMPASPWRISRRAPLVGEHTAEILNGQILDGEILGELMGESLTVFRSRLRDDVPDRYFDLAAELHERARGFPGFVEFKQFVADDGERVTLVTFDSAEHEAAWRDDVEHRAAQHEGRESFYSAYDVAVCDVHHRHTWTR